MYVNFLIPKKYRATFWKYGFFLVLIFTTYFVLFINLVWVKYEDKYESPSVVEPKIISPEEIKKMKGKITSSEFDTVLEKDLEDDIVDEYPNKAKTYIFDNDSNNSDYEDEFERIKREQEWKKIEQERALRIAELEAQNERRRLETELKRQQDEYERKQEEAKREIERDQWWDDWKRNNESEHEELENMIDAIY